MAKIIFDAPEPDKSLWIELAHDERVPLAEWIRRRLREGVALTAQAAAAQMTELADGALSEDDAKGAAEALMALAERGGVLPTVASADESPSHVRAPRSASAAGSAAEPARTGSPDGATRPSGRESAAAKRKGMCPHRVPAGSYCKRCGTS